MSRDPGPPEDDPNLQSLVEMYRTAIAHLESLQDPAVRPLKRELEALLRFAGGDRDPRRARER